MTFPESIVMSLDWSKKLKEVGWPQGVHSFDSNSFWIEGWDASSH
jgi:hypothetical protein